MVIAVLGAEPIKDPSIGDWEGGCVLERNGALLVPSVGCGLTWVWGGRECQMAGPHLICKDAAPECGCAIMNRGEKKTVKRKKHSIISKATPSTSNGN